jgi:hypothetical protein
MHKFPIDTRIRELRDDGVMRGIAIWLWVPFLSAVLPWRVRCAVWNWMWQQPKEKQINWRTHKPFGDERK